MKKKLLITVLVTFLNLSLTAVPTNAYADNDISSDDGRGYLNDEEGYYSPSNDNDQDIKEEQNNTDNKTTTYDYSIYEEGEDEESETDPYEYKVISTDSNGKINDYIDEEKAIKIRSFESPYNIVAYDESNTDRNIPGWYKDYAAIYNDDNNGTIIEMDSIHIINDDLYTVTDNKGRKWYVQNIPFSNYNYMFCTSDPRKKGARFYPGVIDHKKKNVIIWYDMYTSGKYNQINPYDLTKTKKIHYTAASPSTSEDDNLSKKDIAVSYNNRSDNISQPEDKISVNKKSYKLFKDGTAKIIKYNKKYKKASIKKIYDLQSKVKTSYINYNGYLYNIV